MKAANLLTQYSVTNGAKFRLKHFHPDDHDSLESADDAADRLTRDIARLSELQDKLYAQDRWALLILFQAMDAAGKDSAIKHVMSGVNPQGCQVHSFKQPSIEELDHDYLWRAARNLPNRGHIGIFNRSYYEEVLVVRVHHELLDNQRIPRSLITKHIWDERCDDIRAFERHLIRNGVVILKFFLNVSKAEQKRRFLARLDEPAKNWKFSAADLHERAYWDDYMAAYEDAIQRTATPEAPWHVVPADHKWFTRLVVASIIIEALERLDLAYPKLDSHQRKALAAARTKLEVRK